MARTRKTPAETANTLSVADALAWRQQSNGGKPSARSGYARFRDLIFTLHFDQGFSGLDIARYLKARVPSLKNVKPENANSSIRRLINPERRRRDQAA